MKYSVSILILFSVIMLTGCGKGDSQSSGQKEETKSKTQETPVSGKTETVEFRCEGMTCSGCEDKITEEVKKLDGITDVKADSKTKFVQVTYAGGVTDKKAIQKAINEAGYDTEESKSDNPHECDRTKCPGSKKK